MSMQDLFHDGGCSCRLVRYRARSAPLIVHCCHCHWCQRESGSAFALNALFEADRVELLQGEVEVIDTPSESGNGQKISRCPKCRVAVWSNYSQAGSVIRFIRVGTLDEPGDLQPDVHIYTSSKQPWVVLPAGAKSAAEFYNPREVWSAETLARWAAAKAKAQALQ